MRIVDYLQAIRIHHSIKNLVIFIPFFLTLDLAYFFTLLPVFIALMPLSFFGYMYNDLADYKTDLLNPNKSNPLTSNRLSTNIYRKIMKIVLLVSIFSIAYTFIFYDSIMLLLSMLVFLVLDILYTDILKHIKLIDIISVSFKFALRYIIGVLALGLSISWIIFAVLFTFSMSLLFLKRYNKINISTDLVANGYSKGMIINGFILSTVLFGNALIFFSSSIDSILVIPSILFIVSLCHSFIKNTSHDTLKLIFYRPLFLSALLWGVLYYVIKLC